MEPTGEKACDHGLPKWEGDSLMVSEGFTSGFRYPSESRLTRPTHVDGEGLLSMDMRPSDG